MEDKDKYKARSITQPPEIWEQLDKIAIHCGGKRSTSRIARLAFIEFIEKYEKASELKDLKSQMRWRL